jgi:hypothetical protein
MDTALAALEWTVAVRILHDDDLLHAGRLTTETAAAVIERKTPGGPAVRLPGPAARRAPMDVFEGAAVRRARRQGGGVPAAGARPGPLRATGGAGAILAMLGRRAARSSAPPPLAGPDFQELDAPRPDWRLVCRDCGGCLFAYPEGEAISRYIEVGLEP